MSRMRLDRCLGRCGLGSRKELRALVRAGHVTVNGQIAQSESQPVNPEADDIQVDGLPIAYRKVVAILLYKPPGVLSATADLRQETVLDLLPEALRRRGVAPVGRLDKDTTGLLLLTDDGEAAHALISPKRHVDKVYVATLDAPVDPSDVTAFADGLQLSDFTAAPAGLKPLPGFPPRAEVTLREGKFHQVKRMFAARGKTVTALHRTRFGPQTLDESLKPGSYRLLTSEEWARLRQAAGLSPTPC